MMEFFKKLFGFNKKDALIKKVGHPKLEYSIKPKHAVPQRFYDINCIIPADAPKFNAIQWTVINLDYDSAESYEKIYNHLYKAREIRYNYNPKSVIAAFKTSKFGWVECYWHQGLNNFEFGILKTGVRYDIPFSSRMQDKCPKLYDFLMSLDLAWCKEYRNDSNL